MSDSKGQKARRAASRILKSRVREKEDKKVDPKQKKIVTIEVHGLRDRRLEVKSSRKRAKMN